MSLLQRSFLSLIPAPLTLSPFNVGLILLFVTPSFGTAGLHAEFPNPRVTKSSQSFDHLATRYNINVNQLKVTPRTKTPVLFRNTWHETLVPPLRPDSQVISETQDYDVIVVGGGPAGLTSAIYLTDQGLKVLVLERNEALGGLGVGSEIQGIRAGGGAAYSAGPSNLNQYRIFQHIGLGDYKKRLSIHHPIDSYLWNQNLYDEIWDDQTLEHLPASFKLFKWALQKASARGQFDTETELGKQTDEISMADFVRSIPEMALHDKSFKAQKLYKELLADSRLNPQDLMIDVCHLLDLYGRSALGGTTSMISARQFGDFYASELEMRYTGTLGTGTIAEHLIKTLRKDKRSVSFNTNAPVAQIENLHDGAKVTYFKSGMFFSARARKVVFAAPLPLALNIVKNIEKIDPEKAATIRSLKMTDYMVNVAHLSSHSFRKAYDLWVRDKNYSDKDPTDFIAGRWMDPLINGYRNTRDFSHDPIDDFGIISIYHPLAEANLKTRVTTQQTLETIDHAISHMQKTIGAHVKADGQNIKVDFVESFLWPLSIHRVEPGFLRKIPMLVRPVQNIEFANNTAGAPELESAMELGQQAAQRIIRELKPVPLEIAEPGIVQQAM